MSIIGGLLAGAGIGAGLNVAGGILNSATGAVGQGISNLISGGTWKQSGAQIAQNEFNASEAQKARDAVIAENALDRSFQERMSNTAITRQVADMQKAGINPAMAFAGGGANGASTPSGGHGSPGSTANSTSMGMSRTSVSDFTNSVSNLARTFNYDKNTQNDINLGRAVSTVAKIAGMLK